MERWTKEHARAAAQQGWCISEVRCDGHAPWEVQYIQDPDDVGADMGIKVPYLNGDEEAVARLRQAFDAGEAHARLAVELLKEHSQQEFNHWGMYAWEMA
jgi:hypothetical protein